MGHRQSISCYSVYSISSQWVTVPIQRAVAFTTPGYRKSSLHLNSPNPILLANPPQMPVRINSETAQRSLHSLFRRHSLGIITPQRSTRSPIHTSSAARLPTPRIARRNSEPHLSVYFGHCQTIRCTTPIQSTSRYGAASSEQADL